MDSLTTDNKSTYEVDFAGLRVRRLTNFDPTPPAPGDGQWRTYVDVRPWSGPDGTVGLEFVWQADGDMYDSTRTGPVIMATRRVQDLLDECRDQSCR